MKMALIVVDVQNDFVNGSLAVPNAEDILIDLVGLINEFEEAGEEVVYTFDWHPENHSSFKEKGGIWPSHCVRHTEGAMPHNEILDFVGPQMGEDYHFFKGFDPKKDEYSGFAGYSTTFQTLHDYLLSKDVNKLVIVGLALDYCVKATALDAKKLGYDVCVDLEGTVAVNVNPGDDQKAIDELEAAGVVVVETMYLTEQV